MNPTYLEYGANGFYLLAVFLAARNSIHTWWLGVIGCALFAVLFYQVKLYAEVVLMLFFIGTNFIGWYQWGRSSGVKAVTSAPLVRLLVYAALALLVTLLYGFVLHRFTDAYAPLVDSLVLTFSVLALNIISRTRGPLWLERLSMTTTSPVASSGTSTLPT